jgi:DNA-binding protein H-NS
MLALEVLGLMSAHSSAVAHSTKAAEAAEAVKHLVEQAAHLLAVLVELQAEQQQRQILLRVEVVVTVRVMVVQAGLE